MTTNYLVVQLSTGWAFRVSVLNGQRLFMGGHMVAPAQLHEVTQRGQSDGKGWVCHSWSALAGYNCSERRQV